MTDLVAFLNARLDEDERTAKAAVGSHYSVSFGHSDWAVIEHIDRWTSARVLADVEAKREIIAEHGMRIREFRGGGPECRRCVTSMSGYQEDWRPQEYPCRTLRLQASVYSAHADFDQAWAVDVSTATDRAHQA